MKKTERKNLWFNITISEKKMKEKINGSVCLRLNFKRRNFPRREEKFVLWRRCFGTLEKTQRNVFSYWDEEKEKKTETASVFPFVNGKRGEHSGMCFKFFHFWDSRKKHSGMCFCPILVTLDRTQRNVFRVERRKNGNSECVSICNWKNEENTAECVSGWRYASPRKRKRKERRCWNVLLFLKK